MEPAEAHHDAATPAEGAVELVDDGAIARPLAVADCGECARPPPLAATASLAARSHQTVAAGNRQFYY
jgi:hypothetical protein